MAYHTKSQEEIEAAIDTFIHSYKQRTGQEPDLAHIQEKIRTLAKEKEEAHFQGVFNSYNPESLMIAANLIGKKITTKVNDLVQPIVKPRPVLEMEEAQKNSTLGLFGSKKDKKK